MARKFLDRRRKVLLEGRPIRAAAAQAGVGNWPSWRCLAVGVIGRRLPRWGRTGRSRPAGSVPVHSGDRSGFGW